MIRKAIDKYHKLSPQVKASAWFAACSVLQKGISTITVPIFTRLMTDEQYGTFTLYNTWSNLLTIITSLYLFNGVLNNAMVKYEDDRDRYIASMQGLTILMTTVVFVIYVVTQGVWYRVINLAPVYMIIMFIEMLFAPALSYWSGKQRFEYKYVKLVIVTVIKSVLNPVVGLIAVYYSVEKDLARIISIVAVEVVICGIIMVYQFVRGKVFFVKEYWKYALKLGFPLLPHYLSGMILNRGDTVVIEHLVGRSKVAYYGVAYNIGFLVQLFTNAIGNAFIPWMYQKIKGKDYAKIGKTVNILLLFVSAIAFGVMLLAPEAIWIFGDSGYASAVYVVPPVAASVFFIFLYNLLAVPQFYYEKTNYMLFASIAAALVNIVLNFIFIDKFGYVAAGYTTLVCYVFYSFGHFIISKSILKEKIGENAGVMFDTKVLFLLSIMIIGIGITCNFLFPFWYIRYGIILIGLILCIIYRKKLIKFFIDIKAKK